MPSDDKISRLIAELDIVLDPYMAWHDGIDYSEIYRIIGSMTEREKASAAAAVVERIAGDFDERNFEALKTLGVKSTVPAMAKVLERKTHPMNVTKILCAILTLDPENELAGMLPGILDRDMYWGDKIDVLVNLRILINGGVFKPYIRQELVDALYRLVGDDDYLVRYHACNAILATKGISQEVSDFKELFQMIITKDEAPTDDDRKRFAEAVRMLKGLA